MTKVVSIRLDDTLWGAIKDKPNVSRYIGGLVKQDVQMQFVKPIVKAVIDELLSSELFFTELRLRLEISQKQENSITNSTTTEDESVYTPLTSTAMERGCCVATKPCQHWTFDGITSSWINSLSGRRKAE